MDRRQSGKVVKNGIVASFFGNFDRVVDLRPRHSSQDGSQARVEKTSLGISAPSLELARRSICHTPLTRSGLSGVAARISFRFCLVNWAGNRVRCDTEICFAQPGVHCWHESAGQRGDDSPSSNRNHLQLGMHLPPAIKRACL
ncbi:MAG: hypothetical protein CMJ81_15775 [Planctomycetaceae bacterium]|nr:hypothetical protein [Planctomycetaceae bacterium]MBP63223.1 hypothetical protein [Planctomycetaceae bacterium]